MKRLAIALAAVAMMTVPAAAKAPQCRDAHGHFMKCPPKPAATPTPAASGAAHRCRNAKGKFAKCGTPGAH